MSAAKSTTNGRRVDHLDDPASAAMLCEAERSRKPPDKDVRGRLDPDWSDGIGLAVENGRPGTDQWLKALKTRNRARFDAILDAIEAARESSRPGESNDDPIAGQVEGEPWQDPTLGTPPPAVPFPVDVFPPQLADLLIEQAAALNSPVDYLGGAALATAATANGRSVALRLKDTWEESTAIYWAGVGVSGMAKSPAIGTMTRPLWIIAKEMVARWKEEKDRESRKPKDEQGEVPPLRRTVVDDATVEALGPILQDNPRGIGQIKDELTALVSGMNQYKSGGKGADRQFYLSAWSGSPWAIDRKNNPDGMPVLIPHPFISIMGGLVNSKLATLSDAKDRDDGFIERLLFSVPDPVRVRWHDDEVDHGLIESWELAIRRLWDTPMVDCGEAERPWFVKLEPAARTLFKSWHDAHSEEMESLDFPAYLMGTWSKMRAYCGRFALIIDRLAWAYDPTDGGNPKDVSASSVRAAIRLVDYFKAHAKRAHALIRGCGGQDNENARAILRWVYNTKRRVFDERGAKLNFKERFPQNSPELNLAIAWLIERRCVRPLPTPPIGPKGGRPATRAYEVNPALLNPILLEPEGTKG